MNPQQSIPPASVDDLDAETLAPATTSSHQDAFPDSGTIVDDYEILDEIARGGMGVVYRARQTSLDRIVAFKMLLPEEESTAAEIQRFQIEARAAAELEHPGIVHVYDVGSIHGRPYFTMAYVKGESLAAKLLDGPLAPEKAAALARDVALPIEVAHQRNIIHCDLKPANILLTDQGEPRITDFGICKTTATMGSADSKAEGIVGTPQFMPPEQARNDSAAVGPAADVYAIGAVLYTMLTGRPPFQAATPYEIIGQVLQQTPVRPRELNSSLPRDLETITLKCLEKRIADRYASSADLASDLQRFLDEEPIRARPPGIVRLSAHLFRKQMLLASVSGSAALLITTLCVCLAFAFVHARQENAKLADENSLLVNQLRGERQEISLRLQAGKANKNALVHHQLTRWRQSAEELADAQPQLAIQLAAHACKFAEQHHLQIPQSLEDITSQLAEKLTGESLADANTKEVLALINQQNLPAMTERDRVIFDLQQEDETKP